MQQTAYYTLKGYLLYMFPVKKTEMDVSAGDMTLDFVLEEGSRELYGEHICRFELNRTGSSQSIM